MILLKLAYASLKNRKVTTLLTVFSIALSVCLLLLVEKTRVGAKDSFSNTISQTDLIVGARTGPIQLLLYSVFHMGEATNNISYESYLHFKNHESTEWVIPYSLGDSHRGFRVVATNEDFYRHYHYRRDQGIQVIAGSQAKDIFDVVLGADVAQKLGYQLGDSVLLTHGTAEAGMEHDDKPFKVVGILAKTATPIDRSLYITLEGMEAIHIDWKTGAPPKPGEGVPANQIRKEALKTEQITAFLLRTKSRVQALYLQREINEYRAEPLLGIIPGVALSQLWQGISFAEDGLRVVTWFVLVGGLVAMLIALYTSLNERRREMAILRGLGATPRKVLFLMVLESGVLTLTGVSLGTLLTYAVILLLRPLVEAQFGLYLPLNSLSALEWTYLIAAVTGGIFVGLLPAWKAYRNTLSDGLSIRV